MKYFQFTLLSGCILCNLIQCPKEVQQPCSLEEKLVCAFNKATLYSTYQNMCIACQKNSDIPEFYQMIEYYEGPCQIGFSFIEIYQNVTIYQSKSFYYTFHYYSGMIIDCSNLQEYVCGYQNCYSANSSCYMTQTNNCLDIFTNDILYFYGKCENHPNEMQKLMNTLQEYKICQNTINYLQDYYVKYSNAYACEQKDFPCFAPKCSDRSQDCDVFKNQTCEEYQQSYQILSNYQIKRVNNENSSTLFYIELQCLYPYPTSCDNFTNQVCASYKCGDTTCRKDYQNECLACMNRTTTSYFQDNCSQMLIKGDIQSQQNTPKENVSSQESSYLEFKIAQILIMLTSSIIMILFL